MDAGVNLFLLMRANTLILCFSSFQNAFTVVVLLKLVVSALVGMAADAVLVYDIRST